MLLIRRCFLSVCILYAIYTAQGQGVCYERVSVLMPRVAYSRMAYTYTTTCGWNGWTICTRTAYRQVSSQTFVTSYSSLFGCCTGYSRTGTTCTPVCTGGCNNRGSCVSPNLCSCNPGWTANDCGTDINECSSSSTSMCQHMCENSNGSYSCSCNSGYRLNSDGQTCTEIHECNEMADNCEHICHNSDGSFYCSCNSGYSLSTNGYSCINDNECTLGTDQYAQVCQDNPGSYTCSCHAGYSLQSDGYSCTDINECAAGTGTCGQNCHNIMGSYTCSCNTGYSLNTNGRSCDDVNECNSGNGGCEHVCANTVGSYQCSCNTGYSLGSDQRSCNDVDECAMGIDNCDQNCANTMGSYTCTCNAGYQLNSDGHTCNDINECASSVTNMCEQGCINMPGSFMCGCNSGYAINTDLHSCSDIDECLAGTSACDQICQNSMGSYTCRCNSGYILNRDQRTCDDINECRGNPVPCAQICINNLGSYQCACSPGYRLEQDGSMCTDMDECANGTSLCDQICTNTQGSYTCSCNAGYIIDANGYGCDDINECGGLRRCEQACNNTAGSYQCACLPGYTLAANAISCQDVDECSSNMNQCEQNCMNSIGSYTCSCGTGYTLNQDGLRCNDVNECAPGGVGNRTCLELCLNSPGSWQCGCSTGKTLTSDGVSCRDMDECAEGLNQCDQFCSNTDGSYTCSCNSSTTLNADGFHCDDIDECALNTHNCATRCFNTYGSFYCGCDPGYTLNDDEQTCGDLNECDDGTHQCEQTCSNTVGSHTCGCNEGYFLTSDRTSCLGPPQSVTFSQVDSRRFAVSWSMPINDSRDGQVRSYTLSCGSQQDQNYVLVINKKMSDREFSVRDLQPFTNYSCCVSVRTNTGTSPDLCSTQRTSEEEPSAAPETMRITSEDSNSISFTLTPPIIPNGVIIAYTLYITFDNGTSTVVVDRSGTGILTLDGLSPYQLVMVQVSANTSIGEGPRSALEEIRTQQDVPSAVTGVVVEVTSNSSVSVRWDPPARANGILLNYTIRVYNRLNNFSEEVNVSTVDRRRIEMQGLYPYIPYSVEVTAYTIAGEGQATANIVFTEHGVPTVPILTNTIRISNEQAKIIWIPLTPDEARGVLTNLRIVYTLTANGTCLYLSIHEDGMKQMDMAEDIDTQSEAVINGLIPTEQYCVAIQVSTIAGESGFSQVLTLSLPSSIFIQIRYAIEGNTTCQDYLIQNNDQKVMDVSSSIVEELLQHCGCPYSLDYITNARLLCGESTNEVIYQCNLLNSGNTLATDLQNIVQIWVDSSPEILVGGVLQNVQSYCQVGLTVLGETDDCVAIHPTTLKDEEVTKQTTGNTIGAIIGGVTGGVVFILLLFILMGFIWFHWRRKSPKQFRTSEQNNDDDIYDELVLPTRTQNIAYGVHNSMEYTPAEYEKSQRADYELSLKSSKYEITDYEKVYGPGRLVPTDYEESQKVPADFEKSQRPRKYLPPDYEESQKVPANRKKSQKPRKYIPPDYEESQKLSQSAPVEYEDLDSTDKKKLIDTNGTEKEEDNIYSRIDEYLDDEEIYESMI